MKPDLFARSTRAFIAAVFLAPGIVNAQASQRDTSRARADSIGVGRLNTIVTTATRTERTVRDVPVSTSVMPGAEVRSTPAQTIDDVLRSVPAVQLPFENAVVAHPTSNFVSMRGLGGIRTLVLLDGVPVNDPFFGYVQWNKIPMELVDRIEVVRGASSNLFGTYALGGVINIITRTPRNNEAIAEASYGTNNTRRGNLLVAQRLTEAVHLTVNGNYSNTDGYLRPYPQQIGPLDRNGWGRAQNLFARADFTPSPLVSGYLRTNVYAFDQNQGSPGGNVGQHAWDLAGGVERRLGVGGSLRASVFYEKDRPWTNNADPITARGVDEFVSNLHSTPTSDIGGSFQWSQLVSSLKSTVAAGVDVRSITGEDRADIYSAPGRFSFREIGGGTQRTFGVFAQDDWFPTTNLEIVGSARLDAWENTNAHHNLSPGAKESFPDKSKSRLDPRLSVRYRAADALTLRGAVYQAFNAPNLDQLYRPYSAQSYANVPNSQLGPETLAGGEVGAEYAIGTGSLQLNVFRNELRDVITYSAIAFDPVYTTKPVNLGKSRAQGAELFGDWEPVALWHLSGSYTYTESVITENPDDETAVGKTNGDTPRHSFVGTVGYAPRNGLSAFVRGRYLSSRFPDASDARVLSPHFVLDASASMPVGRGVDVFVQAENVLNRLYVASSYGFDARGTPRQVFVGARARMGSK